VKFGVVQFPGSNCDQDAYHAIKDVLGKPAEMIWHEDRSVRGFDCIVLPGGFSYGDYLRTGAIARFSPIMDAVRSHAERGGFVMGICNGFQVLCEAHLLPGALMRNTSLKFACKHIHLRVENSSTAFTRAARLDQVLRIPIAHGEGCYVADSAVIEELNASNRVLFRYCDQEGRVTAAANPNGSVDSIAGIANEQFNVMGLMPHPERACEKVLGSSDGRIIFESLVRALLAA
jgi:phosphoribosylformylglycinamidine synthase